jgi:hypothetical protein
MNIKRKDLELLEMLVLPLLKQKALTKDMSLPFARSLEGFTIRQHMCKNPFLKVSQLCLPL